MALCGCRVVVVTAARPHGLTQAISPVIWFPQPAQRPHAHTICCVDLLVLLLLLRAVALPVFAQVQVGVGSGGTPTAGFCTPKVCRRLCCGGSFFVAGALWWYSAA